MPIQDLHTIEEQSILPSGGLIYDNPIDSKIVLRAMTTQDEMIRLTPSDDQFKTLSNLIENCVVGDKPDISVYDMCLGDYYYLLHKLRIVTYGSKYKINAYCPFCQDTFETETDLDELGIVRWDDTLIGGVKACDEYTNSLEVKLPKCGKVIVLSYQTPRILDDITRRVKQFKAKDKTFSEEAEVMIQKIIMSIKTVDGKKLAAPELEIFIRNMHMADTNVLSQRVDKMNDIIGPAKVVKSNCPRCKNDVLSLFRYSSEFFRPETN